MHVVERPQSLPGVSHRWHRRSIGLINVIPLYYEVPVTADNHAQVRLFDTAPILDHKHYDSPSVLTPESLLREARRQKALPLEQVPTICVLDPDGDLVDHLHTTMCKPF